VKGGS